MESFLISGIFAIVIQFIFHRYGGLSVGGQLPILDVDPEEIQNVLSQLGRMMNISGVCCSVCSV